MARGPVLVPQYFFQIMYTFLLCILYVHCRTVGNTLDAENYNLLLFLENVNKKVLQPKLLFWLNYAPSRSSNRSKPYGELTALPQTKSCI